ncbi:ABC transporter substrate-binding protein [Natrialba aegyptia]|uniref:Ferrichrome-binding protein n=1 Tax=Natrialba aegyptia DSM 13077 TaxID=1227491 RepID=M0ANK8_9EURY|nr:ABC transporter substrate-binding protein [Natrialba aegyptia]ELY98968.1 ferrichrome-binding protein [Natrialba aegyptia DSM 13077]
MSDNTDSTTETPTRRDTLKYGTTLAAGSVLAGCSDLVGQDDPTQRNDDRGSYEACIEPVGCLSLEEVPETWMAITGPWADMAIALGQRDGFQPAGWYPPAYVFDRVGVDWPTDVVAPYSDGKWDKEFFYERNPDVFLTDPNYLPGNDSSWDESDTQELVDTVAPVFGNNIVRRREFHDYELPSLYEAFDRLADLFQERERYEAFARVNEEMQADIRARLDAASERPEIGLVNFGSSPSEGRFSPMTISSEGVEMKQYRDLGITSAFSDESADGGEIDYERLLETDPELLVVHSGVRLTTEDGEFDGEAFVDQFVTPILEHPVGSQLTAARERNIYPGGSFQQGPITNLFQTELAARQLVPTEFGEFDPEQFPDVPEDEQLFDRQEVADIINGVFEQ